ncbi:LOW QUALITY PROTEIN: hypothetical protein Cgig2_017078 [Carnegiea gigantea]|uniref:Uncharacterized protein n=1 Tax=Carnegiea gigantea TaxID=171969 RepID=A0A9Q1JTQ8_9CARY|nr:LOW QUALITY PROTEIN: hypothetical protein Cgig2_017078 [Carnegiea gigantea]
MAALMASRQQISLAPTVLGYIYHDLRETASHPDLLENLTQSLPTIIYFLIYIVVAQIATILVTFPPLFIMLDCLVANFAYPRLDTFSEMADTGLLATKGLHSKIAKKVIMGLIISVQVSCKKVRVKQGTLRYHRNDEKKCVDVNKDYENYFNATVLEKFNTKHRRQETYPIEEEFYPALYRLLTGKGNWALAFYKRVPIHSEESLKEADIFGAIGVSQFSYHFHTNRAFCQVWGPLTKNFHHGAGEVGIALHNLERMRGLPTLGAAYEEFLHLKKGLAYHNKYPTAVVELLRIYAELCEFHKLDHFYREYLIYLAYEEQTDSEKQKFAAKKRSFVRISHEERIANLSVIKGLNSFRFVLPYAVLGQIYHSLREAASHPNHHGKANENFPSHSVIGWLAELFPCLYRCHPDTDCLGDFPTLIRYAGLHGSKLSLPQARHIFRDGRYLSLRAGSYCEDSCNGRDVIDMGLPAEDFNFFFMGEHYAKEKPSVSSSKRGKTKRSSFLQGLNVIPSSTLTSILVKKVRVKNDEKKYVDVRKDYKNYFNGTVLRMVNAEHRRQETYPTRDEFYLPLYRLLSRKRN